MAPKVSARIWQEGDWFIAQHLEIDVASQGETINESLTNLNEAVELYLESPVPTAIATEHHGFEINNESA